jgi:heme/copper-type cytochrome/quinol oxidase subunit 2
MNQPLAETIFWIAAAACLVAEVAILRFAFAARAANKSELVPDSPRGGEIVWAIIPALVLVLLFGATWNRINARHAHMMMDHGPMQMQMSAPPTTGS